MVLRFTHIQKTVDLKQLLKGVETINYLVYENRYYLSVEGKAGVPFLSKMFFNKGFRPRGRSLSGRSLSF